MDAESFVKTVHPLLKLHGFKKSNATWRKAQEESFAVFNVQKSSWSGGRYYVNIGTCFKALGDDVAPTENKCHVQLRLNIEEPFSAVEIALEWFQSRATLANASMLADEDSKKGLVFHTLRSAKAQ